MQIFDRISIRCCLLIRHAAVLFYHTVLGQGSASKPYFRKKIRWKKALEPYDVFVIFSVCLDTEVEHIHEGKQTLLKASDPKRVTCAAPKFIPLPTSSQLWLELILSLAASKLTYFFSLSHSPSPQLKKKVSLFFTSEGWVLSQWLKQHYSNEQHQGIIMTILGGWLD